MRELIFNVEFLSDVVLPATSNTEGNIERLEFIPGSNFLGMVAREYAKFSDSFNVFHSGKVRFGDATLLVDGEATYKMPLSFFHEKLEKNKMVNHHLIEDFSQFKQLKQKRNGYITQNLQEVALEYNYAQKSAYDKNERRSKEGSMYGYFSIPAGTLWQFSVKYDEIDNEDLERLKTNLLGKKRLGKSKSSQYGQIRIRQGEKASELQSHLKQGKTTVVYAKSRIALVDKEGNPTYDLKYLLDGLEDSNIVWEKSQIKTSTFTPYNGAMQTKTYSRVVINSGSVIVLQNLSSEQLECLEKGVGVYLSEGFGELLLNPSFLEKEGLFELNDEPKKEEPKPLAITEHSVKFLNNRESKKRETLALASRVHLFIEENKKLYRNISNSQWGTIRSICSGSSSNFRDEIRDYISDGKVTWKTEQIESLLEEGKSRAFIQLLSMQMPKVNRKGEK
jgi:hypothetical protein